MDETRNLSQTQTFRSPAAASNGPDDATKSLSETERSQPPDVGSSGPSDGDPSRIGRYRVIRRLGQGGFGRVYLARDDDLVRSVAIKVPNPERIARPEDVEAFLVEARILARLDHSHIVPVFDVGRTEDGLCFVVSKLIEGSNLADRMGQARPSFRDAAELVATIADALHYAHTRGLVHRDVKPANILIDASGKPCVADFGLALEDDDFGKGSGLAGTPAYMSPEQARGESHRVDGRSDVFSLGVVLYELLTGRKPFRGDSLWDVLESIKTDEPRLPRQVDDAIPGELERICLKSLSKRASERYSTARAMAEDLRAFLETAAAPSGAGAAHPAARPDGPSDSGQRPIKIVPKGLRSFEEHDADFFLELLPGPRDRDGLPETIRFWRCRIDPIDADRTFKIGLIYGPSGCGKSSMVKAGLLPRLGRQVLPIYIEATPDGTEARLLERLRKACPELPRELGLVDSLARLRRGRVLPPGRKVLLVLDQFEQWLFARRGEENTELVAALRQCDGEHLQAVVMVRDDFWLAASRFMRELDIRLVEGENSALVDLFDPPHARKVLTAFGRAYGALPERIRDLTDEQESFLDQSIAGLVQDGKIISVRLALFAEMVKGKPWTPDTLRRAGGTEGLGLTFLEETFSAPTAPPEHRLHQKAAQGVLRALLPESSTDIKGRMRSRHELLAASGYVDRPRDFEDLIRILDPELRLITPTDPEGSGSDGPPTPSSGRYYQLTHDYLVHSLRDWLTRKQRETQGGRAELRLAERSALWNARPENRHLPSALEWANIRLLTRSRDWTEPQRKMMERAGRRYGILGVLTAASLSAAALAGMGVHRRVEENQRATHAAGLVQRVLDAETAQVPEIVEAMREYRRWTDPALRSEREKGADDPRRKLHASLALLPADASQADYLYERLIRATADELPVLRDALKDHRSTLAPKLWTALDLAKPGDDSLLPAAGALAGYAPDDGRWDAVGGKVARALVTVNPVFLGSWLDALRPVRSRLTSSLSDIFRDPSRLETEHSLATNILADYASDDPGRLAELLMVADPKAYRSLFPIAEKKAEQILPIFRAELARKATYSWNDPPLDPTWTKPDDALASRIESAQGMLSERFAFCQAMSLDDFPATVEALRTSGYRPLRLRPFADGPTARVAAIWTRDGRPWRVASGLTADEVRQQDERNRKEKFLPVDVAGYMATGKDGQPADRYAALWVAESGDDDARMYVGMTADQEAETQGRLKEAKLIPRTMHAMIGPEGRPRYSGVWGRPPGATVTGLTDRDQFEGNFEQNQADRGEYLLIDVAVHGSGKPRTIRERALAAREMAEKTLMAKPDDLDSRLARAVANLRLGEDQHALDDLQRALGKDVEAVAARQSRVIALARLGKKSDALSDLETFRKGDAPESSRLYLTAVVAAELGEGADRALEALEAALRKRPQDADLRYAAVRAFSLASRAVSRSDKARGRRLAERSLQWLKEAVRNDEADFGRMDEDADLDPIRDDPAFAEIMKEGRPDHRYAAAWNSDAHSEATSIHGLDPAAHSRRCRELIAQGYRPVAWSVSRTTTEGPPVTASVWHRPTVPEEVKDRLAERQARAAVALVRLDRAEEVWPLLRHSADPRLRSFLVNWLNPLGAEPRIVAAVLARSDFSPGPQERGEGGRRPGQGSSASPATQPMDAVLFQPETSQRRALILALGTFGADGLSPGEREALAGRLLDLYRDDPDSGIHGAAEWTLRQWKRPQAIKEADAQLMELKNWGQRRWYVNSQGQTFAVIEGPVEFRMGSPRTETERISGSEAPRRVRIPRRYALAAKEVTSEQFQRFLKRSGITIGRYQLSPSFLQKFSPDPEGPWIALDWYTAAHYCNWLSEQEGLPKGQWCYLPNEGGAYAEGMSIPADVLDRTGYRLPTEAEWEYACRAGAVTSRYYGHAPDLLGAYVRYQANSGEHAWICGSLLPNDLGLFDMLGNVYEWSHDSMSDSRPRQGGVYTDCHSQVEYIREKIGRRMRSGAFNNRPAVVRSADRYGLAPASRGSDYGFRLARTCHQL